MSEKTEYVDKNAETQEGKIIDKIIRIAYDNNTKINVSNIYKDLKHKICIKSKELICRV